MWSVFVLLGWVSWVMFVCAQGYDVRQWDWFFVLSCCVVMLLGCVELLVFVCVPGCVVGQGG